jgi:alkylation response protein AidB-like acyl-CoA dehydrogenase
MCVIAEELGRVLAPVPVSSSIYLAAELINAAGTEAQKQAWLPRLASGEAIGTFAFAEGAGRVTPRSIACAGAAGVLNGSKAPVPDGDVADVAVVAARTGPARTSGRSHCSWSTSAAPASPATPSTTSTRPAARRG